MRRLIMWNMVTLDGYFDGERSWEINWHRNVWGEELERIALESRSAVDGPFVETKEWALGSATGALDGSAGTS